MNSSTLCARFLGASFLLMALAACTRSAPNALPVAVTLIATGQATASAVAAPPAPTDMPITAQPAVTSPVPHPAANQPISTPAPQAVVIALPDEPQTLHPFYARTRSERAVGAALFVGCISEDSHALNASLSATPVFFKTNPVALGCESVPNTLDGSVRLEGAGDARHWVVDFRIRKDWRWTDGTSVLSRDALFAWRFIMNPAAQLRDALTQKIYSFEAVDETTVRLRFMSAAQARAAARGELRGDVAFEYFGQLGDYDRYAHQTEPLFDEYYWAALRWLPAHALAGIGVGEHRNPNAIFAAIGDGAYEIAAWNKGSEIILNRSATAFPAPATMPNGNATTLIFKFAASARQAVTDVVRARANLALAIESTSPLDDATQQSAARVIFRPLAAPALAYLVLNTSREPFNDVLVRKAALRALQPPQLAASIGLTVPLAGALMSNHAMSTSISLLREAGWACDTTPCAKVITQTARGLRVAPITKTLELTLTVPGSISNAFTAANALQQALLANGFLVHMDTLTNSHGSALFGATGLIPTRNFDAVVMIAPMPFAIMPMFACDRVPSPKNNGAQQLNYSGICLEASPTRPTDETDSDKGADPARGAIWLNQFEFFVSNYAPIIPLGQPVWYLPTRDMSGIDYGGFGSEIWNAWMWGR